MSFRHDIVAYASGLEGAWRDPAWDIEGDVFKTDGGKIFTICAADDQAPTVTFKLPPDDTSAALTLPFVRRATWPSRWVTAVISSKAERDIVVEWVAQSYRLVTTNRRPSRQDGQPRR